jgi:hypothetical protein
LKFVSDIWQTGEVENQTLHNNKENKTKASRSETKRLSRPSMPTKYVNDQHVGCAYTCKIQRLHNYPEFEKISTWATVQELKKTLHSSSTLS